MFYHPETASERIKLNRQIEGLLPLLDKRTPTTEELELISGYTGNGGLASVGAEGPGLLQEFYTTNELCELMWKMILSYKPASEIRSVLEPAVGTGRLLQFMPASVNKVQAYEISKTSATICKLLFPEIEIINGFFESRFFQGYKRLPITHDNLQPQFDIVIGNPPYGTYEGKYAQMGEKELTKAETFDEYFILRGLQLLKPDGLLCYIIGATKSNGGKTFLEKSKPTKETAKTVIARSSEIIEAFRLPAGLFVGTDVSNEIILLKKVS